MGVKINSGFKLENMPDFVVIELTSNFPFSKTSRGSTADETDLPSSFTTTPAAAIAAL